MQINNSNLILGGFTYEWTNFVGRSHEYRNSEIYPMIEELIDKLSEKISYIRLK